MKKIFKKNQIIISGLAIMIAVAGYLNFTDTNFGFGKTATTASDLSDADVTTETASTSDTATDIVSDVADVFTDEEPSDDQTTADADTTDSSTDSTDVENAGETVLTSSSVSSSDFLAEAKTNRENIRTNNQEMLMEVINNTNVEDSQKTDAINEIVALVDASEREAAAELLLEAKGFTDAVVSITDDSADVVVNLTTISDDERAQIEDIMKRKTGVSAENIVITPVSQE